MTPAEFGEKFREYVTAYIKFADAKAAGILAMASSIVGASAFVAPASLEAARHRGGCTGALMLAPLAACAVAAAMAAWHALSALSPRTTSATGSIASFVDVAGMEVTAYTARITTATAGSFGDEYSKVNHALSTVARAKFESIANSVFWTRLLILSAYSAVVVYALIRPGAR